MASERDLIIAIADGPRPPVKAVRLIISRDSSVSVLVPYHPAKTGTLLRFAMPKMVTASHRPGHHSETAAVVERYDVDVPVKLSIHASGFVQFSSASSQRIRSGRSEPFAIPKGLGLQSKGLTDPIESGPTFGATFQSLQECERLAANEKTRVLLFDEDDFFNRDDHDAVGRHIFSVEGFFFPASVRSEALLMAKGLTLRRGYAPARPEWLVDFRVVNLPTPLAFLGLCVTRRHGPPDSPGGYVLGGPRDLTRQFGLSGMFPGVGDEAVETLLFEPGVHLEP